MLSFLFAYLLGIYRMTFPEILNLNGLVGDGEQDIPVKDKPNGNNSEEGTNNAT